MKKWLFLLILPLFFLSADVYADTDIALGGTYKCYNGSTLTKTGSNTWDTVYYPQYMKNYINCGSGWTKVDIEVPANNWIHLNVSLPYSWLFTTSGGMKNWDVIDLNTNTAMLAGDNYITGYQTQGDNFHISLINNGDVQSSFWLWFPNVQSLSSSDLASFKSAINSGQLPDQIKDLQSSINSSIDNSKNDIINNQNQSTQDIIDNQDKNNQEVVDSIKGECHEERTKNLFDKDSVNEGYELQSSDGSMTSNSAWYVSDYIPVTPNTTYYLSGNRTFGSTNAFYDKDKKFIAYTSAIVGRFTAPSNAYYVRFNGRLNELDNNIQLEEGSFATSYEPFYKEVCKGGLTGGINDVNDSINDMKDSITSEASPDLGGLSDSAGWLPAGPVDSIINLPLTFFNSVSNALSNTCKPVAVPLPYVNKTIELPCLNSVYEQIDGLTTWINSIGVVASAFILYKYLLALYKWVDDTLTFRENTWSDWGGV